MSLAAPPHLLPTGATGSCPPSPPPVFSVTSAFFQSPFSVSNRNSLSSRNSPPNFCGPLSPSPMCAGLRFQKSIAKEEDENNDHQSSYGLSWKQPKTRLASDWTPLSSKSHRIPSQDRHQTEDRLDRLLAEMGSASPSESIISSHTTVQNSHLVECWELSSLETRFHPVHTSIISTDLRPCLKNRPTSSFSDSSSDESSDDSSESTSPQAETYSIINETYQDMDDRSIKVRFDDERIEEFLTWSRESYDRKGSEPITKLNIREILELKLIKEELGISTSSKSSFSPATCFLSQ